MPDYLGSGVTAANIGGFLAEADGVIVGSEFKSGGHWSGAVRRPARESLHGGVGGEVNPADSRLPAR